MTKQISLCNLLQTAFAWRAFVPLRETNSTLLSRRWEQISTHRRCTLHLGSMQAKTCCPATNSSRHFHYNDDNRE